MLWSLESNPMYLTVRKKKKDYFGVFNQCCDSFHTCCFPRIHTFLHISHHTWPYGLWVEPIVSLFLVQMLRSHYVFLLCSRPCLWENYALGCLHPLAWALERETCTDLNPACGLDLNSDKTSWDQSNSRQLTHPPLNNNSIWLHEF